MRGLGSIGAERVGRNAAAGGAAMPRPGGGSCRLHLSGRKAIECQRRCRTKSDPSSAERARNGIRLASMLTGCHDVVSESREMV